MIYLLPFFPPLFLYWWGITVTGQVNWMWYDIPIAPRSKYNNSKCIAIALTARQVTRAVLAVPVKIRHIIRKAMKIQEWSGDMVLGINGPQNCHLFLLLFSTCRSGRFVLNNSVAGRHLIWTIKHLCHEQFLYCRIDALCCYIDLVLVCVSVRKDSWRT